ncbi:unnamed protein product [Effrenium voratum]|nr:unnamed protein product [Effrenium voratum]
MGAAGTQPRVQLEHRPEQGAASIAEWEELPKAPDPPRAGLARKPPAQMLASPGTVRTGLRATWVDELSPEQPVPRSTVVVNATVDGHLPWTCQICSQRDISASAAACPTCQRSRGTEIRRAYLTTTELTQSVVDAVNDGAVFQSGGSSSSKPKRREKSPSRKVEGTKLSQAGSTWLRDKERAPEGKAPTSSEKHANTWHSKPRVDALDRELGRREPEMEGFRPVRPSQLQAGGSGKGMRDPAGFKEPPPPYHPPEPLPTTPLPDRPQFHMRGREAGAGLAGPPLPTPFFEGDVWGKTSSMGAMGMSPPRSFQGSRDHDKPRSPPDPRMGAPQGSRDHDKLRSSPDPRMGVPQGRDRKARSQPEFRIGGSASAPMIGQDPAMAKRNGAAPVKPAKPPVDTQMDVEALLEAQKKRIESLKQKLNANMA